jgi:hypothetical protein
MDDLLTEMLLQAIYDLGVARAGLVPVGMTDEEVYRAERDAELFLRSPFAGDLLEARGINQAAALSALEVAP